MLNMLRQNNTHCRRKQMNYAKICNGLLILRAGRLMAYILLKKYPSYDYVLKLDLDFLEFFKEMEYKWMTT